MALVDPTAGRGYYMSSFLKGGVVTADQENYRDRYIVDQAPELREATGLT